MAASSSCTSDIVLSYSVGSVQVVPGLLATAVVLGVVLGVLAAGLLCWYVFLPLLSRKIQASDDRAENKKSDVKQEARDSTSKAKKKIRIRESRLMTLDEEGDQLSTNGVAAFASKAKVIYPINQKFRPLADGASNPSLHENSKRTQLPNQIFEESVESSEESLSQGEKEDGSSSTTIHSTTSLDRFYERTFPRVSAFPEVLICNSCDVKLCLYSLCLQSLPLLDTELRQEQYTELEELEHTYRARMASSKLPRGQSSEFQTMEDIERREREYSDHLIQNMEGFWRQLEHTHQFLHEKVKCSYDEAGRIMMSLISHMITVENMLGESQEELVMEIQEKMIRWEHMAKVVESLKYQIQEESECRLNAVSKTLEQLTIKKKITVKQKEKNLTDLFKAFWEEVSRYNKDCLHQIKALIMEHLGHRSKLAEILRKTQKEERLYFLQKAEGSAEADAFIKEYHKLLETQRELYGELEDEEDCKVIDAVAELCKELYTGASQTFEKLVKKLLLQTLPEITNLTSAECENLKYELRHNLSTELEKAENERKTKIKLFQEILVQEKQLWAREQALSATLDKYVCDTQQQIIQEVLDRLSGLSEESHKLAVQRHKFLLRSAIRTLSLRNVAMGTLTQMRMSRKIVIVQELKEQQALEKGKWHLQDEEQWQTQNEMECHISEEEGKLEEETWQARSDFQQQLLLDLTEANHGIRQHMERAIGQTLIHHAQQEAAKSMIEENSEFKERLLEAAVESVYVTSNSASMLAQSYYQNIEQLLKDHEKEKSKQLKALRDITVPAKLQSKQKFFSAALKEKAKGQESGSALHKRLVSLQRQLLEKFSLYQQSRLDSLRHEKSILHLLEGQLENKLKDAEQDFIAELATLARIRLTDSSPVMNRSGHADHANKALPLKKTK
ncbi:evC complex member EVC isoform X2 [Hyperolius riggenbachi]|uniref:evC complex member EVC isoform X2 n=1 Tax=Hyperolius riggenbachi TaxID=752182 RepID=UPI0035A2D5EF